MIRSTVFFFFNDTATTEIYTLSLHDALPIFRLRSAPSSLHNPPRRPGGADRLAPSACRRLALSWLCAPHPHAARSEEHTSELQSRQYLVCRLLLEKKKIKRHTSPPSTDNLHR